MTVQSHVKFEEKVACGLENDEDFAKFSPEPFENLKNLHFNNLLLTKV